MSKDNKEMTGVVLEIFPERKISEKLTIREFDFQTDEDYPNRYKVQTKNKKLNILDGVSTGDIIRIKYNLQGRRVKDAWYATVDAWALDVIGGSAKSSPVNTVRAKATEEDDLPF